MKTSEFIKQFNELDMPYGETHYKMSATKEESFACGIVINVFKNNKFEVTAARLPEGANAWDFYGGAPFSPKMLEFMAELAKTPPEEREEQPKYVILNGLPRHGTCYYFFIDRRYGQLIPNNVDGAGIEKHASFSEEWLHDCKKMLTPELAAAIDMMTVTQERAIELTEKSKHDDLD
ncbi:hypothetical protein [Lactobacillus delbrueckii]|uniref:hypothetical protein n=1 Tax=Lactobacillus delbrueckii TaxID=1584 RepID=UPI00177D5BC9|nr:hypothetical protein [Lactobacillus delbrueckii]MBD5834732.1 hypothetical protein [Lactobacillus delbrueckii]